VWGIRSTSLSASIWPWGSIGFTTVCR
jgi:hypothetical protein